MSALLNYKYVILLDLMHTYIVHHIAGTYRALENALAISSRTLLSKSLPQQCCSRHRKGSQ